MNNAEQIQADLKNSKVLITGDAKTAIEQKLAEEIQALLSEAIEATASDDREGLVSIFNEVDTLSLDRWDLTTRVKQLLETDTEEDSE